MDNCLPPEYYFDNHIFELEQEIIFKGQWQFFGFTSEVEEDGDYVCRDVGGKSVMVQNFRGTLKGFLNVCSHRFSAIRNQESGSGPLRCPYHGWTYDQNGIPVGIPFSMQFPDLTHELRAELALEVWRLEICGKFIFIKSGHGIDSLDDFLGNTKEILEKVSVSIGEKLDLNRYNIQSNWKVAVENALESYHVAMVHSGTFDRLGTSGNRFQFDGYHSSWESDVDPAMILKWQRVAKFYNSRHFQSDGYFHQLIFPNITIVTVFGTTFGIQHFRPVSPVETECTSFVFSANLAEPSDSRSAKTVVDLMNKSSIDFNRQVFQEDKDICEIMQKGLSQNRNHSGILSSDEERVTKFQRAYQNMMAKI